MKLFSLPADFKTETLDEYKRLNDKYEDSRVLETYGQLTHGPVVNSGRVVKGLPEVDYQCLEEYVRHSMDYGIEFNYTLNPACMGNHEFSPQGVKDIKTMLRNLYNIGIDSLTLSAPALVELVKSLGTPFRLRASAICEIMTPDRALFYQELGIERIVIDVDVTRDFEKLRNICRVFKGDTEIIINNVCLKHCGYKMFHYNHEAHATHSPDDGTVTDYFYNRCAMQKAKSLKNITRLNWIRPEDLKYYRDVGITVFKIQGRQNVLRGDPVKALEAYIKEDYDGNLYDLITIFAPYTSFQPYLDNKKLDGFVKIFFENPDFCKDTCGDCDYCGNYARKAMHIEKVEELNRKANEYFDGVDCYTRLLEESDRKEAGHKETVAKDLLDAEESSFDFE